MATRKLKALGSNLPSFSLLRASFIIVLLVNASNKLAFVNKGRLRESFPTRVLLDVGC